jgi:hypothetical protein
MAKTDEETTETEEESSVGSRNDARLALLSQISDSAEEVRRKDGWLEPEGEDSGEETTQSVAEEAQEVEETASQESVEDEKPDKKRKFHIKVDGSDIELTEDELIARASKVSAADKYLEEAKRAKEEFLRVAPSVQDVRPPSPSPDEEDSALVRAIQVGTEEEAKAALRKLRSQLSVQPDVVLRTIDERLAFQKAADFFQSEYKDIAENKELLDYFLYQDSQMIRNGDKRPYVERYTDIGEKVRKLAGMSKPQKSRAEKLERKESTPSVPKAASTRNAAPQGDDEDNLSEAEYQQRSITAMAKARGQFVRG